MSASDIIRATTEPKREGAAEAEAVLAGARQREVTEAKGRKHDPDISPAVMNFYNTRHEPVAAADPPMAIGGPSFLGLGGGSSRAYLMEEDRPASLVSKLFLLVVLAALGYAAYRNWAPIRGYVGEAFQQVKTVSAPAPTQSTPDSGSSTAAPEASTPAATEPAANAPATPPQEGAGTPASAAQAPAGTPDTATSAPESSAPSTTKKAHHRRRRVR